MLTPLELDIMKAVWWHAPITVRDVQESIRPSRNLAYTTVMTLMDRLYHKGFLRRSLRARAHYYESAIDYADVRDEAVELLIKNFFRSKEELQDFLRGEPPEMPAKIPTQTMSTSNFDETLL